MESAGKNDILILEDKDEKASLRYNLEKILKPENYLQKSKDDNDYSIVQTINLKEKINERIKGNHQISMEELINDIKTEVDKIIGDYSESTQIDSATKQIEIDRKRKIASELNDYLNIVKLKKPKADVQDSPVAPLMRQKEKNLARPVVYTTRLDEMNIFRKKLKKLDHLYIWEEILRESKPVYNQRQTINLTEPTLINKDPEKLINDINIINKKKTRKIFNEDVDVEVIDISSPTKQTCLQSKENNHKAVGKRKLKRKTKANDKVIEQTVINIDDEVIDLTDIDVLNNKIEKDIIEIDTITFNKSQDLSEKVIHESDILSENLETIPLSVLKNINRVESIVEVDDKTSVESEKISVSDENSIEKRETFQGADVIEENVTKNFFNPIVYTTRLNDMHVLQYTVKYLDGNYVINEILRESKPNIKYLTKQKNRPNSVSKIDFQRLKIKLKILNRKNKKKNKKTIATETIVKANVHPTDFICQGINTTDNAYLLLDLDNLGTNFFMRNPRTKKLEEVEVFRNIALIINNKLSNQANMFLTNDSGRVTELRNWTIGSPQNIDDLYKENDPTKKFIKLSTCCWIHTKTNVEKIWSNTATGIARFVQSIHKCLPGNCRCCCRPRRVLGSFKLKFDTSKEEPNETRKKPFKKEKKDKINSLIGRALDYRKPKVVKEKNRIKPEIGQPLLIETNKGMTGNTGDALEYYGIDAKGNIDWQIALNTCNFYLKDHVSRLKRLMGTNTSELNYNKNNHDWLMCTLKAFDVPFNTIKYVKQTNILEDSRIKHTATRKPDLLQLVMDTPFIEHTRKCTDVRLIKIKDILNSNLITKRGVMNENNVDRMLPNILLINPEPSTSGLSTRYPTNAVIQPIPPEPLIQPMEREPPIRPTQPQSHGAVPFFQPILPKPPSQPKQPVNVSRRLIVTCMQFPQMETVVEDVAPDVAMRLIEEFKNISFQIKQGKLVATLRSLVKSTFTDEFQTLAKIVHLTQSKIRDHVLFQDLNIQMNIRCEPMGSKPTMLMIPIEPVRRVPEETTVSRDTDTANVFMKQFLQDKCDYFSKLCSFEKKSNKKSFGLYIKDEQGKRATTDNIILPVISNVFSLTDSTSIELLNEAPKNDHNDSCSSFASSSSIVFSNDVSSQTNQSDLLVYPNNVQLVPKPNLSQLSPKTIVDSVIAELVSKKKTSVKNVTPKNDLSDKSSSTSSSSSIVIINNDGNNSEISQLSMPVYPNYVQMTSENQLLHLSSKTIVDNTIAAMVKKKNTQTPSNLDLEKLETLIPVNFIIDKTVLNDLMSDSSENTANIRRNHNVILRSLLEKKTDIIFDNVLHKKK